MGPDDFSYENLKKLNYLDCVQKEVTRVYGPVNWLIPREAEKDINLNGSRLVQALKSTSTILESTTAKSITRTPMLSDPKDGRIKKKSHRSMRLGVLAGEPEPASASTSRNCFRRSSW